MTSSILCAHLTGSEVPGDVPGQLLLIGTCVGYPFLVASDALEQCCIPLCPETVLWFPVVRAPYATMHAQVRSLTRLPNLLNRRESRTYSTSQGCVVQADGQDRRNGSTESRAPARSGSLRLLYDETNELELQRAARDAQLSDMRKSSRRMSATAF